MLRSPMRAACAYLAEPDLEGDALLAGLASAAGVFYNFSGQNLDCFDWSAGPNEESEEDTDFWGYQWCASVTDPAYSVWPNLDLPSLVVGAERGVGGGH